MGRTQPSLTNEALLTGVALVDDHPVTDFEFRTRHHLADGANAFVPLVFLVRVPLEPMFLVDLVLDTYRCDLYLDHRIARRQSRVGLFLQDHFAWLRNGQNDVCFVHG